MRGAAPRGGDPSYDSGVHRIAPLLVLLCLVALALPGGAQDASIPDTLVGSWRRDPSAQRARSTVLGAFEPRLTRFPELLRPMARDRIAESLPMPDRIDVAVRSGNVRVTYSTARRVVVDSPLGSTTRVVLDDGEPRRVVQRLRGGWLEQIYTNDDGSFHRLLSTEADGSTLHLDYTVHNERLGGPIRWRIDYSPIRR